LPLFRLALDLLTESQFLPDQTLVPVLLYLLLLALELPVLLVFHAGRSIFHRVHHAVADQQEANQVFVLERILFVFGLWRYAI